MQEIVVLSGKGGTGKTSFSAALAHLAEGKVLADADVDAANLHLLLRPRVLESAPFFGMPVASIDQERCEQCGQCADFCRFQAIEDFTVQPEKCEGCGVCIHICLQGAIERQHRQVGEVYISTTPLGPMVHASLVAGAENSGKLVAEVRRRARDMARAENLSLIITDGPPGIGCPVLSCLPDCDLAVLVAEPSAAGVHDLQRLLQVLDHFRVPAAVVINKWDIAVQRTREIEHLCAGHQVPVLGRIPFDNTVFYALQQGQCYLGVPESPASRATRQVWQALVQHLQSFTGR